MLGHTVKFGQRLFKAHGGDIGWDFGWLLLFCHACPPDGASLALHLVDLNAHQSGDMGGSAVGQCGQVVAALKG